MTQFLMGENTMDQNNNNNFMDSRTLWAILLVGVVWFGWQQYINKKYGLNNSSAPATSAVSAGSQSGGLAIANSGASGSAETNGSPVTETTDTSKSPQENIPAPEKLASFENETLKADFSSKGMGLKNIQLKQFKDRGGAPILFTGGKDGVFSSILGGQQLDFSITEESPGVFVGVAQKGELKVIKKLTIKKDYQVELEINIKNETTSSLPTLGLSLEDTVRSVSKGSIFSPPEESQEIVVVSNEEQKDFNLAGLSEALVSDIKQSFLLGLSTHYFTIAFYDQSELVPRFSVNHPLGKENVVASLNYEGGLGRNTFTVKGLGYIGPKDLSALGSVDPVFQKLIKFGFFSAIAKPLLMTMKWIYGFVGNWGLAIILLTLLVRMIVMPLHIMSFRSMKAMQKVQPMITSLREKYKDDPMVLNREMMELMKRHKVNPMGGCLPMLLQIPVFFALYRVFSESIDLYQAPFVFWIHDLSTKDPFFVLPILMAIVMFLQQKLTPSTMDPNQAKVMQFMPLIFSFMMISLPSALTLYMFVSTFFGIVQQYLFLKDKASVLAVKQAN